MNHTDKRNMRNKKSIIGTILIIVFAIGIITFIHFGNDHAECQNIIQNYAGEDGEQISIENHICKERFNI